MLIKKIVAGLKKPSLIIPYAKRKALQLVYNSKGKDIPPREINIGVNNVCNARCMTCDFGQRNRDASFYKILKSKAGDFDINLFKKLIQEVKGFKPKINFIAIEPLLSNNLYKLISLAKGCGLKTRITTNGFLLPEKSKQLAETGLDDIQVSIDGTPKLNNEIRGLKNGFEKAVNGAKALKRYSKNINIHFNYTISNLNYNIIVDTLNLFKEFDFVDEVQIQNLDFVSKTMADIHNQRYGKMCPSAPSSISEVINPKKVDVNVLYKQIREIKRNEYKYPFKIRFVPNMDYTLENLRTYYLDECTFVKGYERCAVIYNGCYITSDGDVMIHGRCYKVIMGNIKKKSFMEIWNGKKYRAIRKAFYKKTPPACARCCGVMFNI